MSSPNFFALFGLEPRFRIDLSALRAAYRQLQLEHHPDKFASDTPQLRLAAVQKAAEINDAYTCLSDTVSRAKYLLSLATGKPVAANNLQAEPAFLMQQIEAREQIEEFIENDGDYDELMALIESYEQDLDAHILEFEQALSQSDWQQAAIVIAKMQLFSKLIAEANELEEKLD